MVDFWAPWRGPAEWWRRLLKSWRGIRGQGRFFKLNTDDNVTTASRYGICSIPTSSVFKGGELVDW
jgi:thioredoxin 1